MAVQVSLNVTISQLMRTFVVQYTIYSTRGVVECLRLVLYQTLDHSFRAVLHSVHALTITYIPPQDRFLCVAVVTINALHANGNHCRGIAES